MYRACGGEPLVHPYTGGQIAKLIQNDVGVGVVTNSLLIDKYIGCLINCTWVGVSVDAGTNETYCRLKKPSGGEADYLGRILNNIETLVSRANTSTPLG